MGEMVKHNVGEVARAGFAEEQRDLIRSAIAPDATEAEFELFLEVAARYELNPLHGEIYLAKMPGRNGGGGRFTLIVGKEGFLAIANRHPDFRGIESDVVHEFDSFKKVPGGVEHSYELGSGGEQPRPITPEEEGEPGDLKLPSISKRGSIIGAWAIVHREGRAPTYFFAPFASYKKNGGPWGQYPDAMIRKVAIANALREAFNLSGLYTEGEVGRPLEEEEDEGWADDPELAERLEKVVSELNQLEPGKWRPARVKLNLAGNSEQERAAFCDTLEETLAEKREEADVVEAEVVDEPEPAAAE